MDDVLIPSSTVEGTLPISKIPVIPQPPLNPNFNYNPELQKLLTGKQLLLDDIPILLDEIQAHYQNGYVTYRKGIEYHGKKLVCARCGNKDAKWFSAFPCSRCSETCHYCRQCIMMGRISECTPLIGWRGPVPDTNQNMVPDTNQNMVPNTNQNMVPDTNQNMVPNTNQNMVPNTNQNMVPNTNQNMVPNSNQNMVPDTNQNMVPDTNQNMVPDTNQNMVQNTNLTAKINQWQGELSQGQLLASNHVVDAILHNRDHLVWAVCGAGKTEVLFAGIEAALLAQKRICIATPRTDVVLELTPRLKAAFPTIPVASLYGGSEDRHLYAPLTIATTHQLLRFYHAFDVVILDEVDAFPYTVEESLQHAAIQARKPTSAIIYLTATPNEKWQRECRTGKRAFTTIPARFHRHPLPVPEFRWCGNWQKQLQKGKLPANVLSWIHNRIQANKQALVFFPHIPLMEKALPLLRQFAPTIEAVHAEDPDRKEKVQKMRAKQIPLLLTTTILERGVTFPNIDVAVIGAEDPIFTESALVQISGRAGRSKDHPEGGVTFFHYGKTEEMLKAKKQISAMNREGFKTGMLDE
jgi:competence protein ComFA